MRINIKATNIELTQAIREYVEKKIDRVAQKLIDPKDTSGMCDVEVGKTTRHHKQGDVFRAEFNLHVGKHHVRAEAEQENLYAAIDMAQDELFRVLQSKQEKKRDLVRKGRMKFKEIIRRLRW